MVDISIVIPVFRSAQTLVELHRRVVAVLTAAGKTFEIIFVEDCGGDNSWAEIKALAGTDERVRGFRMSRNYGQHNAILAGTRVANGSLIVTMDDDLQHPPEELPKLLAKINEGHDVVYGSPVQAQHGLVRNLCSLVTKLALQTAMGAKTARHASAFRVFKTHLRDAFSGCQSPSVNIDVLLTWATAKFTSCPVRHDARGHGVSGYDTRKLLRHAMNMMTGFSTAPLRLVSIIGFFFALFGASIFAYVIIRYLVQGGSVPGFSFLASIVAIFSGAQLLALGMVGEYIARIYERNMGKPTYLICETTTLGKGTP